MTIAQPLAKLLTAANLNGVCSNRLLEIVLERKYERLDDGKNIKRSVKLALQNQQG